MIEGICRPGEENVIFGYLSVVAVMRQREDLKKKNKETRIVFGGKGGSRVSS